MLKRIRILTITFFVILSYLTSSSQVINTKEEQPILKNLKSQIGFDFKSWLKKDEFEKTAIYEQRVKARSQFIFDSIAYMAIRNNFNKVVLDEFNYDLKDYDADRELFVIHIKLNSINWYDTIKVPIKIAPDFKRSFTTHNNKIEFLNLGVLNSSLIAKNLIFYNLVTKNKIEFSLPSVEIKDYKISSNELGIKSEHFDSLEFSLFDYQKKYSSDNNDRLKVELPPKENDSEPAFYTEVDIPAEYPGGAAAWNRYLERNLNSNVTVNNNAPAGDYTVVLSFIVDKYGTIGDIIAENNPGYGTKEEAIRVLKKSGGWKPAVQKGRNVISRQKISITFYVRQD